VSTDHFVQLFDSDGSLAAAVSTFIQEGLADGDVVVIVTTGERWDLVSSQLASRGVLIEPPIQSRRLIFMDARSLLQQFMRPGGPAPELFEISVARVVRALAANTNRLRIYGDMVDRLAGSGDYASAHRLEILWNELASSVSFQLFCGYSALNFESSHYAEALRIICRCHSGVRSSRDDTLSSRLLDGTGAIARA
jgi:MEDS: MEthanogen/methylotroph, DcmR Sensory domain